MFAPTSLETWRNAADGVNAVNATNFAGQICTLQLCQGVPSALYRYAKREHADDLLIRGRLRLGTLFSYVRNKSLNSAQRDENEGWAYFHTAETLGLDGPVSFVATSADRWMLCLSDQISHEMMIAFGVDAVLRISGQGFFDLVAENMAVHSDIGSLDKVAYVGSATHDNMDVDPSLAFAHMQKPKNYEYQSEWRLNFERRGTYETSAIKNEVMNRFGLKQPNDVDWVKRSRTNGVSGETLSPVFVEDKRLSKFVTDVTSEVHEIAKLRN